MSDFKKVLDGLDLPDELKQSISEAWDAEVQKNRQEIKNEMLSETTSTHEQDLESLVEAADAIVTSTLEAEMKEFREERKKIREQADSERVKNIRKQVQESKDNKKMISLLENMVSNVITKEVKELHEDRKQTSKNESKLLQQLQEAVDSTLLTEMKEFNEDRTKLNESMVDMENLVVNQLTRELSEFQEDRKELSEKSARLDKEYERKLEESKNAFMDRASKSISEMVDKSLHQELSVLKEDIQIAKENDFGRKIFETFAAEYMTSHLSEGTEIHKLRKQLEENQQNMQKMQQMIQERERKLNKSNAALRESRDMVERSEKMNKLLRPLSGTQRETMKELLENVSTDRLDESFNRYIPSVLDDNKSSNKKQKIIEGQNSDKNKKAMSESTGDREVRGNEGSSKTLHSSTNDDAYDDEIKSILRQAGIK